MTLHLLTRPKLVALSGDLRAFNITEGPREEPGIRVEHFIDACPDLLRVDFWREVWSRAKWDGRGPAPTPNLPFGAAWLDAYVDHLRSFRVEWTPVDLFRFGGRELNFLLCPEITALHYSDRQCGFYSAVTQTFTNKDTFSTAATDTAYVMPAGAFEVHGKAWGGGGAGGASKGNGVGTSGGSGGGGGYAYGEMGVTPGESGHRLVGGGGSKGANNANGGEGSGGGGYTALYNNGYGKAILAGGGAGGAGGGNGGTVGSGGPGGGSTGAAGSNGAVGNAGQGGTQAAGGAGGTGGTGSVDGAAGTVGGGGAGGHPGGSTGGGGAGGTNGGAAGGSSRGGGGGGAGLYGGGGGEGGDTSDNTGGGGGGGSNQLAGVNNTVSTQGSGTTPGNTGDADYSGSAGLGGTGNPNNATTGTAGTAGRLVVIY